MDRHVVITPVVPKGNPVTFNLLGDAELTRSGSTGGGWQIVDRPRRSATTEWLDYSPFTLQMSLLIDGMTEQPFAAPLSVEADVLRTESWEVRAEGKIWPAVLQVTGPVPHNELRWVVQALDWGAAIRHPIGGYRMQQAVTMTLLEYAPATIVTANTSPAKAAQQRADTSSTSTSSVRYYTVKAGDTLPKIATAIYGDFRKWTVIGAMNGINDPTAIQPGQVLLIPGS